jgi:hypothetical protein
MSAAPRSSNTVEARAAVRAAWQVERDAAATARRSADHRGEWNHLQRAHILSQPLAGLHLRTHCAMLAASVRRRDGREIAGQLVRLILAGPGSVSGRYPVGNTGGADVSAFSPMAVPEDLRPLLLALGGAR